MSKCTVFAVRETDIEAIVAGNPGLLAVVHVIANSRHLIDLERGSTRWRVVTTRGSRKHFSLERLWDFIIKNKLFNIRVEVHDEQ